MHDVDVVELELDRVRGVSITTAALSRERTRARESFNPSMMCLRLKPLEFGSLRPVPKNICDEEFSIRMWYQGHGFTFVVTMKSDRFQPSSLKTRPCKSGQRPALKTE